MTKSVKNTFEEKFPSYQKISFAINTNNKQLFSYRNNIRPVIPEDVVKNYLKKHCVDKKIIIDILERIFPEKGVITLKWSTNGCDPKEEIYKELELLKEE